MTGVTSSAPDEAPDGGTPPLLERLGTRYLEHLASQAPAHASGDAVHVLNAEELARLSAIQRAAVLRAGLVGALSALASAAATVLAAPLLGPLGDAAPLVDQIPYWAVVGGVTVVASVLEIGFLYWDALRATHLLASAAGLELSTAPGAGRYVVAALARAALELPNPKNSVPGVNPDRETSRLVVAVAALAYKLKVAATSFLLKALLRRALGRAAVRIAAELVAVPVTAAWNAVVCAVVLREARLRAMGPSAAHELVRLLLEGRERSAAERAAVFAAIAAAVVRTGDSHPNHAALFDEVRARLGAPSEPDLDDTAAFLLRLRDLEPTSQRVALRALAVATVIDGRLKRSEVTLLRQAHAACDLPFDPAPTRDLRRAFTGGRPLDVALLAAIAPEVPRRGGATGNA